MELTITLSGDLPARCAQALAALAPELSLRMAEGGVPVRGQRGDRLAVCFDGETVAVTWAQPVQFYRALSLLPRPLSPCRIEEKPCFETVGICSTVPATRFFCPKRCAASCAKWR